MKPSINDVYVKPDSIPIQSWKRRKEKMWYALHNNNVDTIEDRSVLKLATRLTFRFLPGSDVLLFSLKNGNVVCGVAAHDTFLNYISEEFNLGIHWY